MSYTQGDGEVSPAHASPNGAVSHIEPDEIGVGMLIVLFAFCAIVILLIVVLLQAWFYNWKVDLLAQKADETVVQQTPADIARVQLERIETYGWVDPKTKKERAIPIGRAMELVAEDMAAGSAAPAAPGTQTGGTANQTGGK